MNKILLILFLFFILPVHVFADDEKPLTLLDFHFYKTNKKGKHVVDYIIERNDRFDFYYLTIMNKTYNSAFVLNDMQFKDIVNLLYDIGNCNNNQSSDSDDIDDIDFDDNVEKNIWSIKFFISSEKSLYFSKKGWVKTNGTSFENPNSIEKLLLNKIKKMTDTLDKMAYDFKNKYKDDIIVLYYNSKGPNGLAGILCDRDGRIIDQTIDVAFTVSIDGPRVYSYSYGIKDSYTLENPDKLIDEITDAVSFKNYEEPEVRCFVTDAAPPNYCVLSSNAISVSSNDEDKFKNHLIRKRYDGFGIEKLYPIIDLHTNFLETIESHNPSYKSF